MLKRFSMLLLIFVLALAIAGPASASAEATTTPEDSGIGGIVRTKDSGMAPSNQGGLALLTYHGGPIMRYNKVYTIFWIPAGYSVSGTYISKINQYFMDVAAASGATSNVYYTEKQYYSMPGRVHISGKTFFGSTYTDTHAFPASGCGLYGVLTECLTDAQIKAEIKRVIAANGWTANSTSMFFMFTPDLVGTCITGYCSYSYFCAYHGYTGSVIYANQPYTNTYPSACGVSVSPTGDIAADSTINVASHEHREAINDFHLNAWYDIYGNEGSDKCAWDFGSLSKGYNQTISGHHYVLQKEWSNYSQGCVLGGK